MKQEETSRKQREHAEENVRLLQAKLAAAKKGERAAARKHENHHKYMMGGVVHKYFPECYEFNEDEMNEIISCAFSYQTVKSLIQRKKSEKGMREKGSGEKLPGATANPGSGTMSELPTVSLERKNDQDN